MSGGNPGAQAALMQAMLASQRHRETMSSSSGGESGGSSGGGGGHGGQGGQNAIDPGIFEAMQNIFGGGLDANFFREMLGKINSKLTPPGLVNNQMPLRGIFGLSSAPLKLGSGTNYTLFGKKGSVMMR